MDPSFGARLRAQREKQQVALDAISAETKIKISMLEALERDDVSQWPEGIYRRAYVRAYARAVGLDPETLVREFLEVHPDPIVIPRDTKTELENPEWPAGFRRLVTSAVSVASPRHPAPQDTPKTAAPVAESPEPPAADRPRRAELSLATMADLCTKLTQTDRHAIEPILEDAARTLNAVGMVVWSWDSRRFTLRPSLAAGYHEEVVSKMPKVRADEDNAIAAAFRSAQACTVSGADELTGAVVVPLLGHTGCAGVLAIELRDGDEKRDDVRQVARILAAQLVAVVASVPLAEAV